MQNTNYVDIAYIALELTKLNDKDASSRYLKILSELTGIKNIGFIDELVQENKKLKQDYNNLLNEKKCMVNHNDLVSLIDFVEENNGVNMEPCVGESIISTLKKYI